MPIYEYKCHGCGKVFDRIQKFSDEPLKTHDACGGVVERLISAPAFHLKGSGWYVTDYAKGGSGGPVEKKPSDSGSESSEAKSSDTKTETRSESTPAPAESKPAATTSTSSTTDAK